MTAGYDLRLHEPELYEYSGYGAREGPGTAHTSPSRTCPKTTHRARQHVTKTLCMSTGCKESKVPCARGSSSRLKHLDYVGYLNFSSVIISHFWGGQMRERASEHACVTWFTTRERAGRALQCRRWQATTRPWRAYLLQGRKSSTGHPTKCSHCSQLSAESSSAQHSDWASPHTCLLLERVSYVSTITYKAAASMKTGPGGTLKKGVKFQTGWALKIQHRSHSQFPPNQ